jgi:acyl-CoA thioester hydrolase
MLRQHEIEIRVRYSETDAMGFLHHANYFSYFEMGRTELFRAQGGNYRALEGRGYFLVVTRIECRYLAPARYDDVLTLSTTLAKISAAKLEHSYELLRDGQLLTTGNSVLACLDREGRVQRIPDVLSDVFPKSAFDY